MAAGTKILFGRVGAQADDGGVGVGAGAGHRRGDVASLGDRGGGRGEAHREGRRIGVDVDDRRRAGQEAGRGGGDGVGLIGVHDAVVLDGDRHRRHRLARGDGHRRGYRELRGVGAGQADRQRLGGRAVPRDRAEDRGVGGVLGDRRDGRGQGQRQRDDGRCPVDRDVVGRVQLEERLARVSHDDELERAAGSRARKRDADGRLLRKRRVRGDRARHGERSHGYRIRQRAVVREEDVIDRGGGSRRIAEVGIGPCDGDGLAGGGGRRWR